MALPHGRHTYMKGGRIEIQYACMTLCYHAPFLKNIVELKGD
jgi:hypothetical protein